MTDFPDILNTPVLPAYFDAFWGDEHQLLEKLERRENLFITQPLDDNAKSAGKLQAIIKACGLNEEQYHVIQLTPQMKIAWHLLRDKLEPKYIVLLGIELEQLALTVQFMPHQVSRFDNRAFVPTLSIEQLDVYPDIKKHFWTYGLKPVFVDKVYG